MSEHEIPAHLRVEVSVGGLRYLPRVEGNWGTDMTDVGAVRVYDSSSATQAALWLCVADMNTGVESFIHLPLDRARQVAEQILRLAEAADQ